MQSRIPEIRFARGSGAPGAAIAMALTLLACGSHDSGPHVGGTPPTSDQIPASISIGGGQLASGTARGPLRQTYSVGAFRAQKYPTTVAEYRQCVNAGACTEPASRTVECGTESVRGWLDQDTYQVQGGDLLPVTCVEPDQARTYCAWVGGDLPTMTQWELAARGSQPTEYSWGAHSPTCGEHPATGESRGKSPCAQGSTAIATHSVGAHHKGASPFGIEDVLLTRGELLLASADAQFPACRSPMTGCLAYGSMPGAIEGFAPTISHDVASEVGQSGVTVSFRCVWSQSK